MIERSGLSVAESKARFPTTPGSSIQVIARAAAILRALEEEPDGLSLAQIAGRVGLARSTVQRIVGALAAEHLLISASPTSGVKLGPALVRLASAANIDIDQLVRPVLTQLSQTVQETVDLSMLKGSSAVFIDQLPGAHRLRAVSAVGQSFPLYCTANGKALLSQLPEEQWTKLVGKNLRSFTANTITSYDALRQQIKECQRTNVAYDREEHTEGIAAVGTAFLDPLGRPLAISIPVPTARFPKITTHLVNALMRARKEIKALVS